MSRGLKGLHTVLEYFHSYFWYFALPRGTFPPIAFYADLFATSSARLASIFSVFSPWFIRASLKHGKYGAVTDKARLLRFSLSEFSKHGIFRYIHWRIYLRYLWNWINSYQWTSKLAHWLNIEYSQRKNSNVRRKIGLTKCQFMTFDK